MTFEDEQLEILRLSDELETQKGRSWYKFKGDVINRIIIYYLTHHIDTKYFKVIGPGSYIQGYPIEFDILIVDKVARPQPLTNAFEKDKVKLMIEVKKHGFFFSSAKFDASIRAYLDEFKSVGTPFLYITIKESRRVHDLTVKYCGDISTFLRIGNNAPIPGAWEKFISAVQTFLPGGRRT